jgi:ribosomal-protein-alanine N-acetyltransferase
MGVAPSIERALPEDSIEISRLLKNALPPGWPENEIASSCSDEKRLVLKAKDGPVLLGSAVMQFAADEAEILAIAVFEENRRRGIASRLLAAALRACEEKLIRRIYLEVAEGNWPAIKLYEASGFAIVAHRKNYYQAARPEPETALIMRLDIKPALTQIAESRGKAS